MLIAGWLTTVQSRWSCRNKVFRAKRRRKRDRNWPIEALETRILLAAPTAYDDSFDVTPDTTHNEQSPGVLGNDTDPESDPLTAILVDNVTSGMLTLYVDGSFDYTPYPSFTGIDSFTYKANDGLEDSNVATVTLDVGGGGGGENSAPTAVNDSYSVNDDQLDTAAEFLNGVLENDTDADSDPLTAVLVADPQHGTVTLNGDGSFVYEPDVTYIGEDTFTYKANDGTEDSNVATVTITVSKIFGARANLDDRPLAPVQSLDTYGVSEQTGEIQLAAAVGGQALRYQSLAESAPIVTVETVYNGDGINIPTQIEARLTFGGVVQDPVYYDSTSIQPGNKLRIALESATSTLATDRHDYELRLIADYGSDTATRVFTGTMDVVKQEDIGFGLNWSPSELDRLVVKTDGVMLVQGMGIAAWYQDNGDDTFTSPAGPLRTTSLIRNMDGSYTLSTKRNFRREISSTGLLTSRVDPNGNTVSYVYIDADSDGKTDELSTITDPYGRTTTFNYTSGRVSSVEDFAGRTTTLGYDVNGRLETVTLPDPDGAGPLAAPVTTYAYNTSNLLTSLTDPLSRVVQFQYDFADHIQQVTNPDSTTRDFDPAWNQGLVDTDSGVGTQSNPATLYLADGTSTSYDEMGNPKSKTYDRFGFVTSFTDPLSNKTTYTRDSDGLLIQTTEPDPDGFGPLTAPVTSYQYDANGNLTQITFPDNSTQSWVYDLNLNLPTGFTDELNRTSSFTYDTNGNLLTQTDAAGNVVTYVYNAQGLVTGTTYPDPDDAGPLSAPVTGHTYDSLGRMTQITNPDGTTRQFGYDSADNLTSVTDELGRVTTHEYDSLGRLTTTTLPDPDGAGPLASPITTSAYNAGSLTTSVTDADGNVTSFGYDNRNRLTSVTYPDPDGTGPQSAPVVSYTYNSRGDRISETDPLGNTTDYAYDSSGRLTSIALPDPDGSGTGGGPLPRPAIDRSYDNLNRLTSVTDPLSNTTSYEYDSRNRLTSVTDALSNQTQFAYDAVGNRTTVTDALGNVTTSAYDNLNRLTSVTYADPDGAGPLSAPVMSYAYDNLGRLTSQTDPLNNSSNFEYDLMGRLTRTTDPLGNEFSKTYDDVGNLLTTTLPDPDGAGPLAAPVTTYVYDNLNRLTSVTDALSGETSFEYDVLGRVTQRTDPLDRITGYSYDNLGRLTALTLPIPAGYGPGAYPVYAYGYDAAGNLLTESNPDGNDVSYAYDNLGRTTSVTDERSGATAYEYDSAGNLTRLTDSVNNATTFAYDALNRLTGETNAFSDTRSFVYDALGNLTSQTDRNGRVTEYDYDNLSRLTEERWKDGAAVVETVGFAYDAGSRLTSASDSLSAFSYAYDDLGNVLTVDNDGTPGVPHVVLTGGYDNLSRRTSVSATVDSTDDFANAYQYDALSRTTRVEQTGQAGGNGVADKRIDLTYNALGQFSSITRYADPAGTQEVATSTYAYDAAGLLSDLTHARGVATFADYDWTHDWLYRVTGFTSPDGSTDYTYDDSGQVTAAVHSFQTDESYGYDANGNRTNTGYSTGTNNRLTSDGTYDYEYDAEGNRTKKTEISSGDYVEYAWDHHNRLRTVNYRDSQDALTRQVEYDYDLFDRRSAKRVDETGDGTFDTQRSFVYDGFDIVLVYDGTGSLTNRYLHGPATDQFFASEDDLGEVLWALADNQGTLRDWIEYDEGTDTTTVVNHLKYDAFGNVTAVEDGSGNPTTLDPQLSTLLYAYTGREWDADAELYYYRARWYDPAAGRFISEDPLGFAAGDANLSRYVGNSPGNFTDPSGTTAQSGPADRMANRIQMYQAWARASIESDLNPAQQQQSERLQFAHMYEAWLNVFEAAGGMDGILNGPGPRVDWMDQTDRFFAGWSDTLTASLTTRIREEAYGDIARRNHQGGAFAVGQVVGVGHGFAIGWYTPGNAAQAAGWAERTAQYYTFAETGVGMGQSTYNVYNGDATVWDMLNFAPAAGWGTRQFRDMRRASGEVPVSLLDGPVDVQVYIGYVDDVPRYTGITDDIARRQMQHANRFDIDPITPPLTRNQARAIEQAIIERNPGFENIRNSIAPTNPIYQDALDWATVVEDEMGGYHF